MYIITQSSRPYSYTQQHKRKNRREIYYVRDTELGRAVYGPASQPACTREIKRLEALQKPEGIRPCPEEKGES